MDNKNFQTFFDCGSSRIRACTFNKNNRSEAFYCESEFCTDQSNIESKIEKIVTSFEKDTNEYIDSVNLMVDSSKMFFISISLSKKLDGSNLKQTNVQFLVQEAKQQILKYYTNHSIAHIIINNYKINGVDYSYLPNEIKCNFISLDIFFICLPTDLVTYFKNIFSKYNISINQIICSSYAKSINYKDNFSLIENLIFIDIGFNKTSIICYKKSKITFLDILTIGGNHITKDISKVINIDLLQAEKIKLLFDKNKTFLKEQKISTDLTQQIVFARIEEILKLSVKSIKLNLNLISLDQFKLVITGDGAKILDNKSKEKISISTDMDLIDESVEDIFQSAPKLINGLDQREVVIIPKKPLKYGFFEKLFHFFS